MEIDGVTMCVHIHNVCFSYGQTEVLHNVTAEMKHGVYGLLGANGAGKTTLISLLTRLQKPSSGRISLHGQEIFSMGEQYYHHIGYLPQTPRFYKSYTIREFLRYMAAIKGLPSAAVNARCDELLTLVNLEHEFNKKVGACSGGMKQRLGIAQALLNDPEILILDEPTAGLDPLERIRFRNLISRMGETRTVLLATHIVPDVEYIAQEILLLKEGRIIGQGSPSALSEELTDCVWQITATTEKEVASLMQMYRVSNVQTDQDGYRLRIVYNGLPNANAVPLAPRLEDVYLWNFGEEAAYASGLV